MTTLNKKAKETAADFTVHACTDVTGFGLLGHCAEMADASKAVIELGAGELLLCRMQKNMPGWD